MQDTQFPKNAGFFSNKRRGRKEEFKKLRLYHDCWPPQNRGCSLFFFSCFTEIGEMETMHLIQQNSYFFVFKKAVGESRSRNHHRAATRQPSSPPWRGEEEEEEEARAHLRMEEEKVCTCTFLHSGVLRRLLLPCPREFFFSFSPDLGNATSEEHDFFPLRASENKLESSRKAA